MAVPIIFLYAVGFACFFMALDREISFETTVYAGLGAFVNLMAYLLSYTDTDYTNASYFPLVLLMFSVVILLYKAFMLIPLGKTWDQVGDE